MVHSQTFARVPAKTSSFYQPVIVEGAIMLPQLHSAILTLLALMVQLVALAWYALHCIAEMKSVLPHSYAMPF